MECRITSEINTGTCDGDALPGHDMCLYHRMLTLRLGLGDSTGYIRRCIQLAYEELKAEGYK